MEVSFTFADTIDPIAVYAAIIATFVLMWDIVKWFREGPRLKARVMVPATMMTPGLGEDAGTWATVVVTNIGTVPTTVNVLALVYWPSWFNKILNRNRQDMFVPNSDPSGRAQSRELDVGKEWIGVVAYNDELKRMANNGYLYFRVYHAFSRRPVKARIRERKINQKTGSEDK